MQKLLLQKSTGAVYPWNKELAKRNDMIDYKPEPKTEKVVPNEVQTMARAVLTKKPGRKLNAEEGAGESEQIQAEEGSQG